MHYQMMYRVSECFSEHDIPRLSHYIGYQTRLVEAIAGQNLLCWKVSHSGNSGWFRVTLNTGTTMSVVIHRRFLTPVGFGIRSTYSYDYWTRTYEGALAEAERMHPGARHERVWF